MNEDAIVRHLREIFSPRIGDDGAVLGEDVVTTDMLVEDVDFTRLTPPALIARKSLAVNLSDLAAMGAAPSWALLALALPPWFTPHLYAFIDAIANAAREHRIEIVGGDLSRSEKLVVAVTASGKLSGRALMRSGGKPGDRIYLSRPIGASATGLALLQQGWTADGNPPHDVGYAHREFAASAIRRHLDPTPESALGVKLASIAEVTACIDISDGLSTDLHRLCEASNCGAEIERERIPVFPDLLAAAPVFGIRPRDVVLDGGEEYALLFTSSLHESELSARAGRPMYAIGKMTSERNVVILEDGTPKQLEARGWDHFA